MHPQDMLCIHCGKSSHFSDNHLTYNDLTNKIQQQYATEKVVCNYEMNGQFLANKTVNKHSNDSIKQSWAIWYHTIIKK